MLAVLSYDNMLHTKYNKNSCVLKHYYIWEKYEVTFMFCLKNTLRKSHINNAFSDWYIMCSSQTAINPINFSLFKNSQKIGYVVVN
jgi:hypothetical protein